jgi:hypothetical protein
MCPLQNRLRQAKTVAVGCHGLPREFHGKEGVDGSSPSEGFAKLLETPISVIYFGTTRAGADT